MKAFSVIVPAAGRGERSGSEVPKQFVRLAGQAVIVHAVNAFLAFEQCVDIVVAVDGEWCERAAEMLAGDARVRVVEGGSERQHSIARALESLGSDTSIILVHDAARPCVQSALIERIVEAAEALAAVIPVLGIADTVKRIDDNGVVTATIAREHLRVAQTPQGFKRELLEQAYAHALEFGVVGTDDASLVEAFGIGVHVIDGDRDNIKITVADDFARAEYILARR